MRDKVSGAIAIPRQAGDVPQPCRVGFPKTSRRQNKSFLIQQFFKNVGEVHGE